MLLERSEIKVKAGKEQEFAAVMAERGLPLLASVPGVKSIQFGQGVENPDKFLFLVEWDTMESHAAFNKSAISPEFRQLFAPYAEHGAMEHFQIG